MTSRLKRKLGDIGVDASSSKANESFCLIGTPLPPLEKSKDSGEFVPLWKQDVRDDQGRRRLHGAFTGGFSAGYFNTVGSKEGWTPSTFVSSRSDRAKQKGSRPEDFMDEEDLAELREGQQLVDTNDEMDLLAGTQAELRRTGRVEDEPEKDAITNALEASMLPPPKDSAGARILKKMGWRIGQGIGPRLTWRQRKLQDIQASTGPEVDIDSRLEEDTDEAKKHTYAPRDTPILRVDRKDNAHGLGYNPGMGLNDSLGVSNGAEGPKGPKLSSGFGLGALNDADEDDLDVYDGSFDKARRHMAYDASERDDDDRIVIGGKQHGARSKPDSRSTSSVQTFHDGRPVLKGFVLSEQPVAEDRWFPLPEVPKGWSPNPKRMWDKNKENVASSQQPPEASQPVPHTKWKAGISADERGTLLGETPLPSAPRSVFEYISQKDRERIQNIASGTQATTGTGPEAGPSERPTAVVVPHTEPHIAQAALRGFQPFTTDPVKQARYTAYLKSQASPDPGRDIGFVPIGIIPGQNIDAFNKELSDYAKAATIFKPISGAMAGRFTSAAIVDSGPKVIEGLHTPSVESENARAIAESQAREMEKGLEKEEETPKAHAARMGLYGRLTREVKPWQPAKLLCKRFSVKDPNPDPVVDSSAAPPPGTHPGSTDPGVPDVPTFTGTESFRAPSGAALSGRQGSSGQGRKDPSNVGLGEDDDQGRDTLTYERPAMDIFKAIFASDEEDSDGDDNTKMEEDQDKPSGPTISGISPVNATTEVLTPLGVGISESGSIPHNPHSNSTKSTLPEKVDTASFKPTFIPRDGKKSKHKDKDKKDKKKKSERTIVSFDLDEDGGESLSLSIPKEKSKDRPKKKKRKDREKDQKEGTDDESIWVEKPPPEVVKSIASASAETSDSMDVDTGELGNEKGRKKAIDFW